MSPKQKAQILIGCFIEGLHKNGNPNNIHEHAKECAFRTVHEIIKELEQLRKPEYTTFVLNYETQETSDGYEKIDYWKSVLEELQNL